MYVPVSHSNGRSIKNIIGVVMNRLVGMGLKKTGRVGGLGGAVYVDLEEIFRRMECPNSNKSSGKYKQKGLFTWDSLGHTYFLWQIAFIKF